MGYGYMGFMGCMGYISYGCMDDMGYIWARWATCTMCISAGDLARSYRGVNRWESRDVSELWACACFGHVLCFIFNFLAYARVLHILSTSTR